MDSGAFGNNDRCDHSACGVPYEKSTQQKRRKLAHRMLDRELGINNRGRARVLSSLAAQDLIPRSKADLIINLNARCYSGQFSEDGSFFFACGQDFKVRLYDTRIPVGQSILVFLRRKETTESHSVPESRPPRPLLLRTSLLLRPIKPLIMPQLRRNPRTHRRTPQTPRFTHLGRRSTSKTIFIPTHFIRIHAVVPAVYCCGSETVIPAVPGCGCY